MLLGHILQYFAQFAEEGRGLRHHCCKFLLQGSYYICKVGSIIQQCFQSRSSRKSLEDDEVERRVFVG